MLYDPVRQCEVADTPEEKVRQALLRQMLGPLGFPKGLIAVEKALLTKRRVDILAFKKQDDHLVPLLLVECKANPEEREAFCQASGYNGSLGAPFLCIADIHGIRTFWKEGQKLHSVGFLPPYAELVRRVS